MPAPFNALKAALSAGKITRGLWLSLGQVALAEIAGTAGFDWCMIDAEHGPSGVPEILTQLRALENGNTAGAVRLPMDQPWLIKKALDIGVQTLLIPMVNTADQARAIVAATRYPPAGIRGTGGSVIRAADYGKSPDYARTANDQICVLVQIETGQAMDNIESIAAVDGIDGLFIGPADLAADLAADRGLLGHSDARLEADILAALTRIRAAGVAAGIIGYDRDQLASYVKAGANFVGVGADGPMISRLFATAAADFTALTPKSTT